MPYPTRRHTTLAVPFPFHITAKNYSTIRTREHGEAATQSEWPGLTSHTCEVSLPH